MTLYIMSRLPRPTKQLIFPFILRPTPATFLLNLQALHNLAEFVPGQILLQLSKLRSSISDHIWQQTIQIHLFNKYKYLNF